MPRLKIGRGTAPEESLQRLAADMAHHIQQHSDADRRTVLHWVARLRRLTKYPQGRVPVMFDGGEPAVYGEINDGN